MNLSIFRSVFVGCAFIAALSATGCAPGMFTRYDAQISNTRVISGLDVSVSEASSNFWNISVRNNTPSIAKLVWDDSSYVTTTGQGLRLLRGQTRMIHSGQTQPASPIAPGATLSETCVAEGMVNQYGVTSSPSDPSKPGRIVLVFDVNGGRQVFEAAVMFIPRGKRTD